MRVPQVRGAGEPYRSTLMGFLEGNSEVLERLVAEMYARGLSTRDVEDAFRDATGELLISKSAVSEVTDRLWEDCQAFVSRDLSSVEGGSGSLRSSSRSVRTSSSTLLVARLSVSASSLTPCRARRRRSVRRSTPCCGCRPIASVQDRPSQRPLRCRTLATPLRCLNVSPGPIGEPRGVMDSYFGYFGYFGA